MQPQALLQYTQKIQMSISFQHSRLAFITLGPALDKLPYILRKERTQLSSK
jgi:hypothetical protein